MTTISSIPTEFNGIEYRSRLEADTARLLTMLGIPFEYEAKSYLLPSGQHYWPDFLLHGRTQALEVRGYSTEKGDRQLVEFADFVAGHGLGRYETFFGVLSPEPIVEPVHAIKWDYGTHGVMRNARWSFAANHLDGPWFMHFDGVMRDRLGDDPRHLVVPKVMSGKLIIERWDDTGRSSFTPIRDINSPSDLVAY